MFRRHDCTFWLMRLRDMGDSGYVGWCGWRREDERAEVLIMIEGVGALDPLEFGNHFVGERRRDRLVDDLGQVSPHNELAHCAPGGPAPKGDHHHQGRIYRLTYH